MDPVKLVKLAALMDRTSGSPDVAIGLIDGPVNTAHPDFDGSSLRETPGSTGGACVQANSAACLHGTFVAGILSANRNSAAPAICPGCTLLIRPIFPETVSGNEQTPSAEPWELATAIADCIRAGARIINLSLALAYPSASAEKVLDEAFALAVRRGVIVAAAAGNQSTIGSSAITRHPWIIPVAGSDLRGRPLSDSNLGSSIGRRGLCAPGERITSLGPEGRPLTLSGTSVAVPFVAGAAALLWSEFPSATAADIRFALTQGHSARRRSAVPPLLDASAARGILESANVRWMTA